MFCLSSRIHVVLGHDDAVPLVIDANAVHLRNQPADFLGISAAGALDGAALEHAPFADQRDGDVSIRADLIAVLVNGDFMDRVH